MPALSETLISARFVISVLLSIKNKPVNHNASNKPDSIAKLRRMDFQDYQIVHLL